MALETKTGVGIINRTYCRVMVLADVIGGFFDYLGASENDGSGYWDFVVRRGEARLRDWQRRSGGEKGLVEFWRDPEA